MVCADVAISVLLLVTHDLRNIIRVESPEIIFTYIHVAPLCVTDLKQEILIHEIQHKIHLNDILQIYTSMSVFSSLFYRVLNCKVSKCSGQPSGVSSGCLCYTYYHDYEVLCSLPWLANRSCLKTRKN